MNKTIPSLCALSTMLTVLLIIPFFEPQVAAAQDISVAPSPIVSSAAEPNNTALKATLITEVVCKTELFYSWMRNPDSPSSSLEEVFFETVTARGSMEKKVRQDLENTLAAAKQRAASACRAEHENETACVAQDLKQHEEQYRSLDYNARRAILSSIDSDCTLNKGRCSAPRIEPIRCSLEELEQPSFPKSQPVQPVKKYPARKK